MTLCSNKKGFTLIELLIVVAIIGILAAIAIPNFLEAQTRAKVAKVQAEVRSIATACETYYIDHDDYPAWGNMAIGAPTLASAAYEKAMAINPDEAYQYWWLWTFVVKDGAYQMQTLTTPVAYLSSFPIDPFGARAAPNEGPYCYWGVALEELDPTITGYAPRISPMAAYIVYSLGPDLLYQLNRAGDMKAHFEQFAFSDGVADHGVLDPNGGNPNERLLHGYSAYLGADGALTYDATNGTISKGDIWRVGP